MSNEVSPPKKEAKQQASKGKGKDLRAKKAAKRKQKSRLAALLNGRFGVMLVGALLIVGVLTLVAVLPTAAVLLAGNPAKAGDDTPTLVAAPLVEAEVSTPTSPPLTATQEADEEQEAPTEEPGPDVVSLSLQPDIRPTPDGAYREGRVPILMYHYVSTPPEDADVYRLDLSVTPEQFEEQMAWLAENDYTTISLYQLTDWLATGAKLPKKPVVLTFDDGYVDNYENAFPILQQYGQVGTFFILTGATEAGNPDYMSWNMLREMAEAGQDIQMHAHIHISVKDQDPVTLEIQVADSADILEERLGYRPRFLAYPGGEYDENAIQALKDADYWLGLTTRFGCLHFTGGEYELQRIRVRGDYDLDQFAGLLKSAFEDEEFCYGWAG